MAITDWTKPLFGNFTPYVGNSGADREATYLGIKPELLSGWDWRSGQPLNIGSYSGANPYQYGSAENEYAGLNGLQNTEGWNTYGSGANEYKVYADQQQNGSFVGLPGADGVDGNVGFSAPTGQRFIGSVMQNDPEVWKVLEPYAKAYGSYDDQYGYTVPEEYYKAATNSLGRWTTKGDWKGPARVISLIASAFGGQLLSNAGLLAEGAGAASAFPSAAGDGFYNFADAVAGGLGGGAGAAGGGVGDLLQGPMPNGANLSNYTPLQGPMPSGANLSDYNFLNTTPQGPMPSGWNLSDYNYINNALQGPLKSGGNLSSPGLLDQIKSLYESPEAQMAKTIASGTQSALSAAQQAGLLGGGQAQAGGGGGASGLLGTQSGGRGRSFAELSPYARGLLRG